MPRKGPESMHLLSRIQRYLRRSGQTPSRFGRAVMNDPKFVHDLRRGREPRIETAARVHAWLDAQEGGAR
jgi:hypothetical protein